MTDRPDMPNTNRRSRWHAQREYIVLASVGAEYYAAWVFFAFGLFLVISWWLQFPAINTKNPVVHTAADLGIMAAPFFLSIGSIHGYALLSWPRIGPRFILARKICSALEFSFWTLMLIASLFLMVQNPNGALSPVATFPIPCGLLVAVLRRRYRTW